MPRQQPEQQAPPVQWLRVQYAKSGPARFTSTRDFGRAFERALRRADVPMAYSSGFNPHPRLSYANSSPTGAATNGEYLEIGLAQRCDPEAVRVALDEALPPGLSVVRVVESDRRSLADALTASRWRVELDSIGAGDVDAEALCRAVAELLSRSQYLTRRMTKTGLREFDVRGSIVDCQVLPGSVLELVLMHTAPMVRPDDVLGVLRELEPVLAVGRPAMLTRVEQGELVDGVLLDPMDAPSRDTRG